MSGCSWQEVYQREEVAAEENEDLACHEEGEPEEGLHFSTESQGPWDDFRSLRPPEFFSRSSSLMSDLMELSRHGCETPFSPAITASSTFFDFSPDEDDVDYEEEELPAGVCLAPVFGAVAPPPASCDYTEPVPIPIPGPVFRSLSSRDHGSFFARPSSLRPSVDPIDVPAFKRSRSTNCYDGRLAAGGCFAEADNHTIEAVEALRNHMSKEQKHYGLPRTYARWLQDHPTIKRWRDGAVRWFIKVTEIALFGWRC